MDSLIFLYGAPASGKTTLGKRLASALSIPFVDLDEYIVSTAHRSIPDIFAQAGEAAFRDLESQALIELTRTIEPRVIALGGGSLLREANRALVERAGNVWCLETPDAEELSRRLGNAPDSRPLGDCSQERASHYASFSKRITGFYTLDNSLVIVGSGIAHEAISGKRIVADATVAKLYPQFKTIVTIPSGERYKTIDTIADLWKAFLRANIFRRTMVASLGGGVTGDLTGFAAATWMRGIEWINVPTTLLAMVDASTGGKTGCDLPAGKNLVGAFHPASLVVIDTDFLKTLPSAIVSAGRAEMIKHEIIGNLPRTNNLVGIPSADEIYRNLGVKVDIVRKDPLERLGLRSLLNCGHSIGHAIEKLTDYRVAHGEAVAIGCVEESRLAVALGLASTDWPEELAARFEAAGLSTALPNDCPLSKLVPIMRGDKKRVENKLMFALPCGWGDVRNVCVDLETLK